MTYYCCAECGFLFFRMGGAEVCPKCDKPNIRLATKEEEEELQHLLKEEANREGK